MAVITPTLRDSDKSGTGISNVEVWTWSGLVGSTNDTGRPVRFAKYSDKCLHVYGGTWGGSTFTLQGSNDSRADPDDAGHASAVWIDLTDAQGNTISKTADSIEQVLENPLWIRPRLTGGTGTGIVATLLGRR